MSNNGQPLASTGPRWARPRWILAKQTIDLLERAYGLGGGLAMIVLVLLGFFDILSMNPEQIAALFAVDAEILRLASVIEYWGYPPGLFVLFALSFLTIHGFGMIFRAVTHDEQLSSDELAVMRSAGRKGWVVDCRGDGAYICYGPAQEQERFSDLADLECFVAEGEAEHGSPLV